MISLFSNFRLQFNNARNAVRQIKDGEWIPRYNSIDREHYSAYRNGHKLWLANGAFFCEIDEVNEFRCKPAFGLIFRHYVWWAAARELKRQADSALKEKQTPIL